MVCAALGCRGAGPCRAAAAPAQDHATTRLEAETHAGSPAIPAGFVETPFGGEGLASIAHDSIVLEAGVPLSGVTWTGVPPRTPYVLELEFTKRYGNDFPCAVTFPVAASHLSLVLGGWGGTVSGLSTLDGLDASRNDSRFVCAFPAGTRCHVRLEVRDTRVIAWLQGEEVLRVDLAGRSIGLREELMPSRPLGLSAYATAVEFHALRWGPMEPDAPAGPSERTPPE